MDPLAGIIFYLPNKTITMKRKHITITSEPAFPSAEPAEIKDGRYKEWQDRARVNLEKADPDQSTNLERDFEPNEGQHSEEEDKFY
jgi:hypothetical protein